DEREAEARAAAQLLGAQIEFLDLGGDCRIDASSTNALKIARQIRATMPNVLLAPVSSPNQHPDHAAVGAMCRDAARLARYGGITELRELKRHAVEQCFGYAVTPGAEPPSGRVKIRVDISTHFARWIELMECHRTQLRTRRYIDLQTARARLLGVEAGVEHAQALFPTDDFLVRSLTQVPQSVRLF
ncbi:MAG TPA: PIG-L family deacetylase, partial [Chthoniobacterales bacterium]|nr:PIG-L family deacetylase [Chthoniobacterales bacterium]